MDRILIVSGYKSQIIWSDLGPETPAVVTSTVQIIWIYD